MAGANYMGGMRNTVKARSKDATRRTQKNFFGNQRLNILANLKSNRDLAGKTQSNKRRRIGLAHANHELSSPYKTSHGTHLPTVSGPPTYTPDNIEIKGSSPIQSTSGPGSGYDASRPASKVLDVLDTSEPILLRAELDRILAMTDLAGISKHRITRTPSKPASFSSKRPPPQELTSPSRQDKRQKVDSEYHGSSEISSSGSWERPGSTHSIGQTAFHVPVGVKTSTPIHMLTSKEQDTYVLERDSSTSPSALETASLGADNHGRSGGEYEDSDSLSLHESVVFRASGYSDFVRGLGDPTPVNNLDDSVGGVHSSLGKLCPSPVQLSPLSRSPLLQQTEDSILNLDTSFPISSSSSLGLSLPLQIPERSIFARYPRSRPFSTIDSMTFCSPTPLYRHGHSEASNSKINTLSPSFQCFIKSVDVRTVHSPARPFMLDEIQYGLTFNQTDSAKDFVDEAGSVWNLFSEDDPWGTIGRLLGTESTDPLCSLEEDMKKTTHDPSGVGYVPPGRRDDEIARGKSNGREHAKRPSHCQFDHLASTPSGVSLSHGSGNFNRSPDAVNLDLHSSQIIEAEHDASLGVGVTYDCTEVPDSKSLIGSDVLLCVLVADDCPQTINSPPRAIGVEEDLPRFVRVADAGPDTAEMELSVLQAIDAECYQSLPVEIIHDHPRAVDPNLLASPIINIENYGPLCVGVTDDHPETVYPQLSMPPTVDMGYHTMAPADASLQDGDNGVLSCNRNVELSLPAFDGHLFSPPVTRSDVAEAEAFHFPSLFPEGVSDSEEE